MAKTDKSEQQRPDVVLNPIDGEPWGSAEAAETALKSGEHGSPDELKVGKYQGGYAIFKLKDVLDAANPANRKDAAPKKKEQRYVEVEFMPSNSLQDQKQIPLGVDGMIIIVSRNERVILPENHLKVADSATHSVFDQQPGRDRMVIGKVSRAPYRIIRENVSREEFLNSLMKGNKQRDNDMMVQQAGRAGGGNG